MKKNVWLTDLRSWRCTKLSNHLRERLHLHTPSSTPKCQENLNLKIFFCVGPGVLLKVSVKWEFSGQRGLLVGFCKGILHGMIYAWVIPLAIKLRCIYLALISNQVFRTSWLKLKINATNNMSLDRRGTLNTINRNGVTGYEIFGGAFAVRNAMLWV